MVVDILYEIAKQHLSIKSFVYDSVNEIGNGSELYPLFWLEDPILLNSTAANIIRVDFNFSITEVPTNNSEVKAVQDRCFATGLSVIEKLRGLKDITSMSVVDFSAVSLRRYYDNNAAGYRFSVTANRVNPQKLCKLNEEFDPSREFPKMDNLPKFDTNNKNGCAIFSDKSELPKFDLNK